MVMQGNLLTAPLSAIKQMGETANVTIQGLGTGITRAASGTLDALVAGIPPLPGTPGAPGAPGAAARGLFPTTQQLLPVNLTQALGQVENLLIPPGLPRPSQVLAGVMPPTTPQPPADAAAPATPVNTGAIASRRQVAERRGL